MFTLFGPWNERKISLKKYQNARVFSKPHQLTYSTKAVKCCFKKSAANIYPSSKYEKFPVILLLTNHETIFYINIMLSFIRLLSQSVPFFQLQVCDQFCTSTGAFPTLVQASGIMHFGNQFLKRLGNDKK